MDVTFSCSSCWTINQIIIIKSLVSRSTDVFPCCTRSKNLEAHVSHSDSNIRPTFELTTACPLHNCRTMDKERCISLLWLYKGLPILAIAVHKFADFKKIEGLVARRHVKRCWGMSSVPPGYKSCAVAITLVADDTKSVKLKDDTPWGMTRRVGYLVRGQALWSISAPLFSLADIYIRSFSSTKESECEESVAKNVLRILLPVSIVLLHVAASMQYNGQLVRHV